MIRRILTAASLLLLAACGSTQTAAPVTSTVTATVTAPAAATATVTVTVTETAEPVAPAEPSSFPDGVYLVGSEIPPGNYKAVGGSGTCVWVTFDATHTGTDTGFSGLAFIKATDYSFESAGCGTWSPVA